MTTATTFNADDLLGGGDLTREVVVPAELVSNGAESGEAPRSVTLRPLLLADIQRIHRAASDGGALTSALMVQQALVEPSLSVEQANRLPAGLVQFLIGEINGLSGLSMSSDELADAVQAPVARACFVLSREFGWTPDECANLTIGQVLLYLEMLGRDET